MLRKAGDKPALVPYQRINDIVNDRRGITPSTALKLAKFFNTSPDFWMNMQQRWDQFCNQRRKNILNNNLPR